LNSDELPIIEDKAFLYAVPVGVYGAVRGDLYVAAKIGAAFMALFSLVTVLI